MRKSAINSRQSTIINQQSMLPAFTLVELLIGMIISTIVIGACYVSYSFIYEQYGSYRSIKNKTLEAMQFNSIVSIDFMDAELITYKENTLTLKKNGNPLQYEFNDLFILRKVNEVTDTFRLSPTDIQAKSIIKNEGNETVVINNFSFDAQILGETEHFTFAKKYDAETLMSYEIQSEE